MKKLKLLAPILGLTATAGMITPMAVSCKEGGGEEDVTSFTVTASEGLTLVDANTAELNKEFETDISWAKGYTLESLRVKVGPKLLHEGDDYDFEINTLYTSPGHIKIYEDIIDNNVTIEAELMINPAISFYASASIDADSQILEGDYVDIYASEPVATYGKEYRTQIVWYSPAYNYLAYNVVVTIGGVEVRQSGETNPHGFKTTNYQANSFELIIPGEIILGDIKVSVVLIPDIHDDQKTFAVDYEDESIIPGCQFKGKKLARSVDDEEFSIDDYENWIKAPWMTALIGFQVDLDTMELNSNDPLYFYFTFSRKTEGSDFTEERAFNLVDDGYFPLNRISSMYYGEQGNLNLEIVNFGAYDSAVVIKILPPSGGWGEDNTRQELFFDYMFGQSWDDVYESGKYYDYYFNAYIGQLVAE